MDLRTFTREIEACKQRWNRRTLQYVVSMAGIALRARKAAGDRLWGKWISDELHMDRGTIFRYVRVAAFARRHVALKQHLKSLTISKIYALTRLPGTRASEIIRRANVASMSDMNFIRMLSRWAPRKQHKPSAKNLLRAMNAALRRIESSLKRWQDHDLTLPVTERMRLRGRLMRAEKALHRIARSAAAM